MKTNAVPLTLASGHQQIKQKVSGDEYEGSNPGSGNKSDSFDEHSDDDYSGSEDMIEIKNASHQDTSVSSSSDISHSVVIATSARGS